MQVSQGDARALWIVHRFGRWVLQIFGNVICMRFGNAIFMAFGSADAFMILYVSNALTWWLRCWGCT